MISSQTRHHAQTASLPNEQQPGRGRNFLSLCKSFLVVAFWKINFRVIFHLKSPIRKCVAAHCQPLPDSEPDHDPRWLLWVFGQEYFILASVSRPGPGRSHGVGIAAGVWPQSAIFQLAHKPAMREERSVKLRAGRKLQFGLRESVFMFWPASTDREPGPSLSEGHGGLE